MKEMGEEWKGEGRKKVIDMMIVLLNVLFFAFNPSCISLQVCFASNKVRVFSHLVLTSQQNTFLVSFHSKLISVAFAVGCCCFCKIPSKFIFVL
jgi:hypothetical protein